MADSQEISAIEAVNLLTKDPDSFHCLDVRSEGEFADGSLPGTLNIPILTNDERHRVGLCYKEQGPEKAVSLGHALVDPHRDQLVENWKNALINAPLPLVNCWRGGMRSQLACDWIREGGGLAVKVIGGYKAMRKELLSTLDQLPELLVISGPTGSNKTGLLKTAGNFLDLESIANHRGSAFGHNLSSPQPSQANFENHLGLSLMRATKNTLFVEDESLMIGQVHLPPPLRERMMKAPVLVILTSVEERVENIFREYIEEALESGKTPLEVSAAYQQSIRRISKKLGGLLTSRMLGKIELAFASANAGLHREWIRDLLSQYYDNAYAFSFARAGRKIAFEGNWEECRKWMQKFA